jgi:hypothetical protein
MTIDRLLLNRDFRKVVALCTGLSAEDVRPANQTVGAAGETFATVLLMQNSGTPSSQTYADIPSDPASRVTETQNTQAKFTASVQVFRKDAYALANKLRDRITLTSALQLMRSLGIGYVSSGAVRDMSMVVNQNWEERAAVDIDFYVVSTETDVITTFGQFPITVTTGTSSTTTEVNEP